MVDRTVLAALPPEGDEAGAGRHGGKSEDDEEHTAARRPASEAVGFYLESEHSRERRERAVEALRAAREAQPLQTASKPNKRDRRLIHRFKQEGQ